MSSLENIKQSWYQSLMTAANRMTKPLESEHSMQSKDSEADFVYKIVLVGDATVGKTHLLSRYIKGSLPKAPTATIGVEYIQIS